MRTCISIAILFGSAAWAQSANSCDRTCITNLVDRYLAAMVKHDPTGLPLAKGVRYTENTAEIEHVLARNMRLDRMQNLVTPRPGLLADVLANERTPRQVMIDAADSYFEAIEHGKGSIAPFADDCERHENGGQTTHNKTPIPWPVDLGSPKANQDMAVIGTLSCTAQIDSQVLSFITRLWPRRLTVVDEQKGLVFSFPMFQHRGGVRSIKIQGVPGVDVIPMGGGTSNLQAGEIFKIRAGKIHEIEAMGTSLP